MAQDVSTASHGVRLVQFALVDDTGNLISGTDGLGTDGVYAPKVNYEGTTVANITNLETAGTLQWGNNAAKRITVSKSAPSVALSFLDIAFDEMQKMLGYVQDTNSGGWVLQQPKPNVAMLIQSDAFDGGIVYEGFAKGNVILPSRSHSTDNTAEVDETISLTYTALVPDKAGVFANPDGTQQPYKIWTSSDSGFDQVKMMSEVFGGYTAGTTTTTIAPVTTTTTIKA